MINKLLAYQEIDGKKREIEVTLAKSDCRKKMIEAKKYLETVEEKLAKLEQRAGELTAVFENAVALQKKLALEAQDFSHAIDSLEDETGANFLVKKVDELSSKIKAVDDEIVKVENEIKSVLQEYAKIRTLTTKAKTQFSENKEEYAKLKESVKGDLDSIDNELEKMGKEIDSELLELYNKKRKEMYPVLYAVRDGYCGYERCNMELPMNTIGELNSGKVVECGNCGKLLFVKK